MVRGTGLLGGRMMMMSCRSGVIWASFTALACLLGYVEVQGESPRPAGAQAGAKESGQDASGSVLPRPPEPFRGRIDLRAKDSKSDFPVPVQAPGGAPNILLVLLDDVGFGAASTFGGPCNTPTAQKLAGNGLRYNRFHTTAICGPSRAALITGRNHHNVATGFLAEWATGFPSYNNMIPRSTATVGSILKHNGYNTSWFGKDHNTPDWESSVAGPYDRWPTGMGFDYFYGFIGG